jgi:hypothetical protein
MVYPTEPRKPHTSAFCVSLVNPHVLPGSVTDRQTEADSESESVRTGRQADAPTGPGRLLPPGLGLWSPPRSDCHWVTVTVTVARCRVPAESATVAVYTAATLPARLPTSMDTCAQQACDRRRCPAGWPVAFNAFQWPSRPGPSIGANLSPKSPMAPRAIVRAAIRGPPPIPPPCAQP